MAKKIEDATATMIRNLKEKTGKSLEDWVQLSRKTGLKKHGELMKLLQSEHGLTYGYANLVAQSAFSATGTVEQGGDELVEAQYAGDKAGLRPLYETLIEAVEKFGNDIEISPKKTYVSLRRSKQFGLIQPSTKSRLDVGLNLKGIEPKGRLEASGSFNAMCSHRVRVEGATDVDSELIGWLKQAYNLA